jgi:K+-sensing histidine kinase KdpD
MNSHGASQKRLMEILEIGRLLVSTLDFNRVLTLMMEKIRNIFHAETSSLLLIDPETHDLEFQVALGNAGPTIKQFRLKQGEGLAGHVALTGESLLISNASKDIRHFQKLDTITHFKTNSMMVTPLKMRDSIIGVVEVINSVSGDFTEDDLELLKMLSPFAAIAIENARYSQVLEQRVSQRTGELEMANRRLREIDSAKSEFLSTGAHELKTPLSAVKTFLTLLADGSLGEINSQQKEILSDCRESIDRLLRMITSLLDMARIEAGVIELKIEKVDAKQKLADVARLLNIKANEKNIELRVAPTEAGFVRADPDKLSQILINFVGNAIKFTPGGGRVEIKMVYSDQFWWFQVIDNGPGMTSEEIGKLFTRFQRLTDASDRKISGTGLGLAISKKLIELQGGAVRVRSLPGEGSTFEFSLPAFEDGKASGEGSMGEG